MESKVLESIFDSLNKGEISALALITESKGSSPGKNGSLMTVWRDGRTIGTIGGGALEYDVINKAKICMETGENGEFELELHDEGDLHMKCGGKVRVYVKVFKPKPRIIIAGAGHIGLELFKQAKILGFYTVVLDDRPEYVNDERFKDADEIIIGDIAKNIGCYPINGDTYIVIVTRGHRYDKEVLKEAACSGASYIGMIGSSKKVECVMKELMEEGIPKEILQSIYAPIGLNIADGEPCEIAMAIFSEILLVKNSGTTQHMKDVKKITI